MLEALEPERAHTHKLPFHLHSFFLNRLSKRGAGPWCRSPPTTKKILAQGLVKFYTSYVVIHRSLCCAALRRDIRSNRWWISKRPNVLHTIRFNGLEGTLLSIWYRGKACIDPVWLLFLSHSPGKWPSFITHYALNGIGEQWGPSFIKDFGVLLFLLFMFTYHDWMKSIGARGFSFSSVCFTSTPSSIKRREGSPFIILMRSGPRLPDSPDRYIYIRSAVWHEQRGKESLSHRCWTVAKSLSKSSVTHTHKHELVSYYKHSWASSFVTQTTKGTTAKRSTTWPRRGWQRPVVCCDCLYRSSPFARNRRIGDSSI